MDIRIRKLGEEHIVTATSYSALSAVYAQQGKYSRGLEYANQALQIFQKDEEVANTNDTAKTLDNVALILKNQAKYDESLKHYQHSFEIRKNLFGNNHPETAKSLHNIASVYYK